MEHTRNSYLVTVSLKKYLFVAIAANLVSTLNSIVDSVLMGRFIDAYAFSAINLCLPLVGVVVCFGQFFFSGATICASIAMGSRDEEKANSHYTVSLSSILVVGILFMLAGVFNINTVAGIFCKEAALVDYVKQYLMVYFLGCPFVMLSVAMTGFAEVGGKPKLVTVASITNFVTNIVGDVVFVKFLDFGIKGAALATVLGALMSVIIVSVSEIVGGYAFKLIRVKNYFSYLKENLIYGVSIASITLSTVIYSYVVSICAQVFCGVEGAFSVSVISQATTLCQGVSAGVSMSVNAIGGMLTGERDYRGVNFLFKRGVVISLIFSAILVGIAMVFTSVLVTVMGAEDADLIAYSVKAVRIALLYILPITVLWGMPSVYAIAGELKMIPLISIAQPVFTAIGIIGFAEIAGNDFMWFGFPAAGVALVLFVLIMAEAERKKSPIPRSFFSLLPKPGDFYNELDISIPNEKDQMVTTLRELDEFLDKFNIDHKISMRIRLCCEELIANIHEYADNSEKKFFDLRIVILENEVLAVIKDFGKPFDPIKSVEKSEGLKIVNGLCPKLDYKYSYSLNMTFLTWDI